MSVLLLAALAASGGLATTLLARRGRGAFLVGLVTSAACLVAAASIDAADVVPLAGSLLGGSDGLRVLAVAWAASTLLFGLIEALIGDGPTVLGPALIGLALGVVGLGESDPGIGLALVTAGAVLTAVVPLIGRIDIREAAPRLGLRTVRPVIASGVIGLLVVAWAASPAGPLGATGPVGTVDPSLGRAMGLALLALALAVGIRLGAIPAHVWVARYAEAMPASAVPPMMGWGSAAFALVAYGWIDVTISPIGAPLGQEHAAIAFIAALSIVLGGVAAILHHDLEHVLAYAIVQDAGVALLGFAASGATVTPAARDWIIGAVAVKAALAAWVLVMRATFGSNQRARLRGWMRRAPILGLAFGIILVAAIGLPTFAAFDARAALVRLAFPGPLAVAILITSFAPLVFLGRLLLDGLGPMSEAVRSASGAGVVLGWASAGGWAGDRTLRRAIPAAIRANRLALAAVAVVFAAAVGLSVAVGGLGSTTVSDGALGAVGRAPLTAGATRL
ncbi:MAG: proton-conducting transporter membrane subunit [Chloroflexota bacterium]